MIAVILVLFYVLLLEFIRYYLKYFKNKPLGELGRQLPAVSVIVPFRNEKVQLPVLMAMLQGQRYDGPKPEILFVNDHSTDGFEELDWPGDILLINLAEGFTGKKTALTAGIEAARGKWIVTTDADVVVDPNWLYGLLQQADDSLALMICGRVDVKSDGSFLQDFQQMETRILQGCGIAAMEAGFPFLNTGASLAFRKDAWQAVKGYSKHQHIASGDDVFLLFDFHQKFPGRIQYAGHSAAVVSTKSANSFRTMLVQRIRWVSKMKYYRSIPVLIVAIIVLGGAFSLLATLATGSWLVYLLLLVLSGLAELRLLRQASFQGNKVSVFNRLLMVLFYPFYLLILTIGAIVYKPDWKGR
jgi:cellulose synthase/poly-beta-1,6-N-acetylglucosamine synthase-like glycosyltransferase